MKKHGNIQMEMLGALTCMNNAEFEKKIVNENIELGVFIYQKSKYCC